MKAAAGIGAAAIGTVTAAAGKLTSELISGVSNVASYGDNIDKASQKLGISAEAYQEWEAVLQHSGTSMDSMTASFKTMANAITEPTDAQAAAFEKLGLGAEVFSMTTEDAFAAVIGKLQEMPESAERTALAQDLLGRGAMELGALFNTSAEDTQAMIDRVHELGGVMSDEDVKAAAAFQDSMQDMQTAMQGVVRKITTQFLPSFTGAMNAITEIASGNVDEGIDMLVDSLGEIGEKIITILPDVLNGLGKLIQKLLPAIQQYLPQLVETIVSVTVMVMNALIEYLPDLIKILLPALINGAVQLISALIQNLPAILTALWEAIVSVLDSFGIIDWAKGVWDGIKEVFAAVGEWFSNLFTGAAEGIQSAWDGIVGFFTGIWDGISAAFSAVAEWFSKLFKSASDGVQKAWDGVVNFFTGIWDGISNAFSAVGTWFSDKFHEAVDGVKHAWDGIKEFFSGIWEKIKGGFKISDALSWGKDLINNFINGIKQMWENLKNTIKNVADTVKNFLGFSEPKEGPLSNFHTYAPDMMKLFAEGVRKNKGLVTDAVTDAFNFQPTLAVAGTYSNRYVSTADNSLQAELRETLRAMRNMRVVMDTGETVGALASPMDGALGTQYIYRKRGII